VETSFSDLRTKIVINLPDGKRLGNVIDLIFEECTARIIGLIVPGNRGFLSIFRAKEDLFIPYSSICKIGQDTILVDLSMNRRPPPNLPPPPPPMQCCSAQNTSFVDADYKNYPS